jgi:hypothetical protein
LEKPFDAFLPIYDKVDKALKKIVKSALTESIHKDGNVAKKTLNEETSAIYNLVQDLKATNTQCCNTGTGIISRRNNRRATMSEPGFSGLHFHHLKI